MPSFVIFYLLFLFFVGNTSLVTSLSVSGEDCALFSHEKDTIPFVHTAPVCSESHEIPIPPIPEQRMPLFATHVVPIAAPLHCAPIDPFEQHICATPLSSSFPYDL